MSYYQVGNQILYFHHPLDPFIKNSILRQYIPTLDEGLVHNIPQHVAICTDWVDCSPVRHSSDSNRSLQCEERLTSDDDNGDFDCSSIDAFGRLMDEELSDTEDMINESSNYGQPLSSHEYQQSTHAGDDFERDLSWGGSLFDIPPPVCANHDYLTILPDVHGITPFNDVGEFKLFSTSFGDSSFYA